MPPGATGSCESPLFVAYRWRCAVSLIVLIVSWNRGKGRIVYRLVKERGVKVHRSVRTRMMARSLDGKNGLYSPKIRFPIDGEVRCLTREEWLAKKPEHFEWVN